MSQDAKKIKFLSQLILCGLLLCVWFSGIVLQKSEAKNMDELVYCPLQKKWVKRNDEPIFVRNPLDEICSTNDKKSAFTQSLVKNLISFSSIANNLRTKDLYFEYTEKGEKVFSDINNQQDLPRRESIDFDGSQKSSSIYKNELTKKRNSVLVETNFPRPPNFISVKRFEFPTIQKLTKISQKLFARPPPIRLS